MQLRMMRLAMGGEESDVLRILDALEGRSSVATEDADVSAAMEAFGVPNGWLNG